MADKDELLDHDYDGIKEYDNDLPRWWLAIFVITAMYGLWYVLYYHAGPGVFAEQQLALDMEELESKQKLDKPAGEEIGDEQLLAMSKDLTALAKGSEVYMGKCLACHGPQAQGLVGPNLTDEFWIHGGKLTDIKNIIVKGVPEKGMLSWKGIISDEEIHSVTAYIWSLQGSNPPNPKAPEGQKVTE